MRLFRHKFRLAICVVLGLPLIYLAEEHLRGRWRLAQWKSAKTAEGERFLIKECLPPPSAEENGFAALSRVAAMQPGQSVSTLAPPTAKYAAPGRMVPIRTLADWPRGPGGPRELRETNVTWVELDRELEQWTDSLEEARSVLKQSAFDSKLDYYAGFSLALPHLARFKGLAKSFAIAAADSLHHFHHEPATGRPTHREGRGAPRDRAESGRRNNPSRRRRCRGPHCRAADPGRRGVPCTSSSVL
jgi:hypothetical protein